jgi:hypothetical protein
MSIREWLHELQEQVLEQAKTSLREGDSEAYRVLTEFAERLQKLSHDQQPHGHQLIKIFSVDRQYQAHLVPDYVAEGKSRCVVFDGDGRFRTPSGIGSQLTGHQVNGWIWWQYQNEKGETRPIDDFRKLRKP